jgi:hypothetical protein
MKRYFSIISILLCLLLAVGTLYFNGFLGQAFAQGESGQWQENWDEAGLYGPLEGL